MKINKEFFIKELTKVVERELELAERGIVRVGEENDVTLPPEHKIIEELLKLLGYGGKRIYVRKFDGELRETIESIVRSDYAKGIDVFSRSYGIMLRNRLSKLGIEIDPDTLKRELGKTRKKLRMENVNIVNNLIKVNNVQQG